MIFSFFPDMQVFSGPIKKIRLSFLNGQKVYMYIIRIRYANYEFNFMKFYKVK
jgi:hypothetical protein